MSVIHVNQIRAHITNLFQGKIDMADIKCEGQNYDNFFLSRALAAYAIYYLAQSPEKTAAVAVTDGSDDNGIDGLFYDDHEKRLYIVQSKWIHSGKSEPGRGEVDKFIVGITDLFNLRFDRFNAKVNDKKDQLIAALNDPHARYSIVVVHTGVNRLAKPAMNDLRSFQKELNDASEVVDVNVLCQSDLHTSLTIGLAGEPIAIDVTLSSWGRVQEPYPAYYGQINATQIADWWTKYHSRLLSKNLRSVLGDTEVNVEMRETLKVQAPHFWYFNNGITIVASRIRKTMVHGRGTEVGTFHCEDISIVNGAQTVATIGRFAEGSLTKVGDVTVAIRLISLENTPPDFGTLVTRSNNRQNRIENRDFVALDPEQTRLRTELAIEGINYHVVRSESFQPTEKSFDVVESTTALACASGRGHLVVQLKREIGKLWDDISRAPYRELFNKETSWLYLWRCVSVQRRIDRKIDATRLPTSLPERAEGILVHGNRLIACMVFGALGAKRFVDPRFDFQKILGSDRIEGEVERYSGRLQSTIERHHPNAVIPRCLRTYPSVGS